MPKPRPPKQPGIVPVIRAAKQLVGETSERHPPAKGRGPSKKKIKALARKLAKGQ